MKRIGILGGTGEIGSRVVTLLYKEFSIKASYHRNAPDRTLENVEYYQVNIEREQEIQSFIEDCDIVINCAGASFLHGRIVAGIASENGTVYIDPFGANCLEEKLVEHRERSVFVLSSGCFPGMTGILMSSLCDTLEKVDKLCGISIDKQIPSLYGTIDFILSGIEGFGEAGCYYNRGKKIRDKICEKICDYESNELIVQKYYTTEIDRISKKYKVDTAIWYAPMLSEEITQIMQRAVWAYLASKDVDALREYAFQIREVVGRNSSTNQSCELNISAEGYVKGQKRKRNLVLKSTNSSDISASVLCAVVEQVSKRKMKPGIYYAADIVEFSEMQSIIEKKQIKVYCNEEFQNNGVGEETYEEGYI